MNFYCLTFDLYPRFGHIFKNRSCYAFFHGSRPVGEIRQISYICLLEKNFGKSQLFLFSSEFLMPGMVDTHIHAPQYSFCGCNVGLPLLDWLNKYTFPTEAKFKDNTFAKKVYSKVVVSVNHRNKLI